MIESYKVFISIKDKALKEVTEGWVSNNEEK